MNIAQIVLGVQKAHRGTSIRFCGCSWKPTPEQIEQGRGDMDAERRIHDEHVAERIERALERHGFYNVHDLTFIEGKFFGKFDANNQGSYVCPYPWCDYTTPVGNRNGHVINEAIRQHLRDKDHSGL